MKIRDKILYENCILIMLCNYFLEIKIFIFVGKGCMSEEYVVLSVEFIESGMLIKYVRFKIFMVVGVVSMFWEKGLWIMFVGWVGSISYIVFCVIIYI